MGEAVDRVDDGELSDGCRADVLALRVAGVLLRPAPWGADRDVQQVADHLTGGVGERRE